MRRWLATVAVLCAGAGVCFFLFNRSKVENPVSNAAGPDQGSATVTNAPPGRKRAEPPAVVPTNAAVETLAQSATPVVQAAKTGTVPTDWPKSGPLGLPPEIVLRNARAAVTQYGSMFHGNPVGTNPEITSALNGNNPKQVKFIDPESGLQINDKGELVDPWGTPFFFHQLSAKDMEVRSAGPDKVMWTADDLVAH